MHYVYDFRACLQQRSDLKTDSASELKLQTVSVTGGLLQVLKPLSPGSVVEVMFLTHTGPVLGMAELLNPRSDARIGLQPFRFITLDDIDLQRLRTAIASSLHNELSDTA